MILDVVVEVLHRVREYEEDDGGTLSLDSELVAAWFGVGSRAVRHLEGLAIPYKAGEDYALKAFAVLGKDLGANRRDANRHGAAHEEL